MSTLQLNSSQESILSHVLSLRSLNGATNGEGAMYSIGLEINLTEPLSRSKCNALVTACCIAHPGLVMCCDPARNALLPMTSTDLIVEFETKTDATATAAFTMLRKNASFSLKPGEPLVRFHFIGDTHSDTYTRLILVCHHLVADGFSLQRIVYPTLARHLQWSIDTPPPVIHRETKTISTVAPDLDARRHFWLHHIPTEIVPIDFPQLHDLPSPESTSTTIAFRTMQRYVSPTDWSSWRKAQCVSQVSSFTWMFASLWSMWSQYSSRFDFGIGVAFLGRLPDDMESTQSFAKVLPLYPHLTSSSFDGKLFDLSMLTWKQWVQHVQRTIREAKRHEMVCPQELLGERSVATRVTLVVTEEPSTNASLFSSGGSSDLTIYLRLGSSDCPVRIDYVWREHVWSDTAADQFHNNWLTLLAAAEHESVATTRTWRHLPWLAAEQERQLLHEYNQTAVDIDICDASRYTLHGMFETTARRSPNALAVFESSERTATYAALDASSSAFAESLQDDGVQPGDRVVVMMPRSLLTMQVILGALKCGAAYVPIDTALPLQRILYIMQQAQARVVVCTIASRDLNDQVRRLVTPSTTVRELVDRPWVGEPSSSFCSIADPSASAYIIFTSGTTGHPKGVEVFHRSACNTIHHFDRLYQYTDRDRVLQSANLSFDISVAQIFNTWRCSSSLILLMSAGDWANTIREHAITGIEAPASVFTSALDIENLPTSLRHVQLAGEPSPLAMIQKVTARYPMIVFTNGYGPTESSIYCNMTVFRKQDRFVPIGPPVLNQRTYILNDLNQLVPAGVTGRIFMGGLGPARGYFGCDELTRDKFVCDVFAHQFAPPWLDVVKPIMYDSGDLARWTCGGVVECLGRHDTQVKWHGYRIELGEIESMLLSCPDVLVKASAAKLCQLPVPQGTETHILIGYVVLGIIEESSYNEMKVSVLLKQWLKKHLPHYMIPSMIMVIETLPISPNGKLDRNQLPLPSSSSSANKTTINTTTMTFTQTALETQVWSIWLDALGHTPQVSTRAELLALHFFENGGNSLASMKLLMLLRRSLGLVDLSIAELYQYPQFGSFIMQMAGRLSAQTGPVAVSCTTDAPALPVPVAAPAAAAAIVGMAGVFPGADDVHQFWDMVCAGHVATRASIDTKVQDDPTWRHACGRLQVDITQFDHHAFGLKHSEAMLIDPQHRMLMQQTFHALEDAAIDMRELVTGVYVSASDSAYWSQVVEPTFIREGETDEMRMYSGRINNRVDQLASRIAYHFDCTGPTIAIQTACSSSLASLEVAMDHLRMGKCDVAIVAAASLRMPHADGYRFQPGMIFSEQGQCRPFERRADGTVPGCAVVALILVKDELALRLGLSRYAVIDAVATGNNGRVGDKVSFSTPSVSGQVRVLERAMHEAGLGGDLMRRRHVCYVESHGTGTAVGDAVEWSALQAVFGGVDGASVRVGAVKANIGHTDVAAGLVGVIKTALVLANGRIPQQPDFGALNEALVPSETIQVSHTTTILPDASVSAPVLACVQSIGVGGTNASAILRRCCDTTDTTTTDGFPAIIWRGRSVAHAQAFAAKLASVRDICLERWKAWSVASVRRSFAHSLPSNLVGAVRCVWSQESFVGGADAELVAVVPETIRPAVVLFAGQGTFSWSQLHLAYHAFESVRRVLVEGLMYLDDEVSLHGVQGPTPPRFLDLLLLPHGGDAVPTFDLWSPLLLCLMQLGLWQMWVPHLQTQSSSSSTITCVLGHSLGEFASAHVTGAWSLREVVQVLYLRLSLLIEFGFHGAGRMAVVRASEHEVTRMIGARTDMCIACCNSPCQTVVSGAADMIDQFVTDYRLRVVPGITVAYHASEAYFGAAMRRAWFERWPVTQQRPVRTSLFAHVSGIRATVLMNDEADMLRTAEYWWQHLTQPVRYAESIATIRRQEDSPPVIIEVGLTSSMMRLWSDCAVADDASPAVVACHVTLPAEPPRAIEAMQLAFARAWSFGVQVHARHLLLSLDLDKRFSDFPQTPWQSQRVWMESLQETAPPPPPAPTEAAVSIPDLTPETLRTMIRDAARNTLDLPTNESWLDVDVFQYGNQSLQVVTFVHRINKLCVRGGASLQLRPQHVYERPTIRSLEDWIMTTTSIPVKMRPLPTHTSLLHSHDLSDGGDTSPRDVVVFIPPGGGTLHLYLPVIQQLARELSLPSAKRVLRLDCIGFQRPDGTPHVTSVERLAQYYLDCLYQVIEGTNTSSIYLVGGSYGGMVAFSMANRMQEQTKIQPAVLRGLFLIDTPTIITHRFPRVDLCAMVFFAMQHARQLPIDALRDLHTMDQVRMYLTNGGEHACIKTDAEWAECLHYGNIFFEDVSALLAFDTTESCIAATTCRRVFAQCRDPRSVDANDTFSDWQSRLGPDAVCIAPVPGHHISMYDGAGAIDLARAIHSMILATL